MSLRKNVLIALAIILLCMLLIMQLFGTRSPRTTSEVPEATPESSQSLVPDVKTEKTFDLTAVVRMNREQFRSFAEKTKRVRDEVPNVRVELTNIEGREEALEYLMEQARLGLSPDIMLLDNEAVNEFAASGYLSHQLEQYIPVKQSKISGLIAWNGYTWAVPYEMDPYVIAVNPAEASGFMKGAPLPSTMEEWEALRARRSADGLQAGAVYIDPYDPYAFISLVWAFGGEWNKSENGMYQLAPGSETIADLLFGMRSEDDKNDQRMPLAVREPLTTEEKWGRFKQGELPVLVVRYSELLSSGIDPVQPLTALVQHSHEEGLWIAGTSFAVSSVSEHPGEAYRWLRAVTENEVPVQESLIRSFDQDPQLRGKAATLAYTMGELYNGIIHPTDMNNRLSELWSTR